MHTPKIKMRGALRIERAGHVRLVALDVDLSRNPSHQLQLVAARTLVTGEESLPIARLPLSPSCHQALQHAGYTTLGQLPNALRTLPLGDDDWQSLSAALTSLGYTVQNGQWQRQSRAIRREPSRGWLIERFLDQPVHALGLSPKIWMRLTTIGGIQTIRDLTLRTVPQLKWRYRGGKKQTTQSQVLTESQVAEIEARLSYYGLRLMDRDEAKISRWAQLWDDDARLLKVRSSHQVTLTQAREILGDQFGLFYGLREAKTRAARIAWRNALVLKNLGLAGKVALGALYEAERQEDPSIDFDDLFQEACIGLMRGVSDFDLTMGYAPSTYLMQWAKQAAMRYVYTNVGIPVHRMEEVVKLRKASRALFAQGKPQPTVDELAAASGFTRRQVEHLLFIIRTGFAHHMTSLDKVAGENEVGGITTLGDFVPSDLPKWTSLYPEAEANIVLKETVAEVLAQAPLLPIEREILELRYGLRGGVTYTQEELGMRFGVSRERIGQRERNALEKLRTPEVYRRVKSLTDEPLLSPVAAIDDGLWHDAADCWRRLLEVFQPTWTCHDVLAEAAQFFERDATAVQQSDAVGRALAAQFVAVGFTLHELPQHRRALATRLGFPEQRLVGMLRELEAKFANLGFQLSPGKLLGAQVNEAIAIGAPERLARGKMQRWDDERVIAQALLVRDILPPRTALILSLRYGLGGEEPHTLEQIAATENLTRERIRQICDRTIDAAPVMSNVTELLPHWAQAVACYQQLLPTTAVESVPGVAEMFEATAHAFEAQAVKMRLTPEPDMVMMLATNLCLTTGHTAAAVASFLRLPVGQLPWLVKPLRQFFRMFGVNLPRHPGRQTAAPTPTEDQIQVTAKITALLETVARRHGVSVADLQASAGRTPVQLEARQEAVYSLRAKLRLSFYRIAKVLGYATDTHVSHAFQLAERIYDPKPWRKSNPDPSTP